MKHKSNNTKRGGSISRSRMSGYKCPKSNFAQTAPNLLYTSAIPQTPSFVDNTLTNTPSPKTFNPSFTQSFPLTSTDSSAFKKNLTILKTKDYSKFYKEEI